MEFHPYEPLDKNKAQAKVWDWFKEAFKDDEGVCYYRYPIFTKSGSFNREPDILMLHREFGLWVIECKSYQLNNIASIQGHEWIMRDWYDETETPVFQAEDQMFALKSKLDERRETRGLVRFHFRVALPNIKQNEWEESGFPQLPSVEGVVLVYENLTPTSLRKYIQDNANKYKFGDQEWLYVTGVLGGTLPSKPPRTIPTGTAPDNPIRVIKAIEEKIKLLDSNQQKIAYEVPPGPQRFRGLAGTGKTVLLAKKAAKLLIKNPDWKIGFVFFTRSLYDQILELIKSYYNEMCPKTEQKNEDEWTKIQVLHAWGGRQQRGFYFNLALHCGVKPKRLDHVEAEIGTVSPSDAFIYICECLLREVSQIPVIYDALIIDEGQDLPPIFYQILYQTLTQEKRIYWAYDEAQGIGSLIIPSSENIFGRDNNGNLLVDVSGSYTGGILKTHIMKKCYRTPRLLLMTAHAINMGLFRKEGPLQGVTRKDDWQNLGYEIIDGDFSAASVKAGKIVTITRPDSESPHPVDQTDFELKDIVGSSLVIKVFNSEKEEQVWIAQQIAQDLQLGFKFDEIIITSISGNYEKNYFQSMKLALESYGINGYIAGVDGNPSIFQFHDCITISNIFRAKGNEAWKVYASRFHCATQPLSWKEENELHKRNEAFVALTRSRIWCVVTGLENPIFDELQQAIDQYPNFSFPAFNKSVLTRVTEDTSERNTQNE